MSMKRRIEYSVSSSVSLFGRVLLAGSVLGLATACAYRDASRTDSAVASADTTAITSAPAATPMPAPAVESVSAGETTTSSGTKATPAAAPTSARAAKPAASVVHHVAKKHVDSTTKATPVSNSAPSASATPAATATPVTTVAAAPAGRTIAKADTGAAEDHLLVSPQEYEGWKMFSVYCYRCHGVDAMGGGIAPNLRHSVSSEGSVTHDVFVTTVTNGRVEKGMPTWKALLSPEQIEDLWQYVTARSTGKLAPGRPHMAGGKNP